MKIRLSLIFVILSVFFLSCSNGISQKGDGYVTVELNEFVKKISSRSAVSGQPVDVTLWTEGDYQTSVTQTVTDNGSEPIILDNIPINSSISINIEASIGKKNFLGASEKIIVEKGNNPVTIRLKKTLPTTDIVLYNQTAEGYSYYLANSNGSNINSPVSFFTSDYGPAEFCFDADGNMYISTNMDVNSYFFYNGVTKNNRGKIRVLGPDNEDLQITTGKIAYDFTKKQVWVLSNGRFIHFSSLIQSDIEEFDYKTSATVYNYRTTDLGVADSVVAACVNDDIAYVVFEMEQGNFPFLLAEYDISGAEVDEENEDEFSIGMPESSFPLCGGMNLSSYAEITDIIYQDGALYILVRDYGDSSEVTLDRQYIEIDFKNNNLGKIYSRGAVIKVNLSDNVVSKIGWTDSTLDTSSGKLYAYNDRTEYGHFCMTNTYSKENYVTIPVSELPGFNSSLPDIYVPKSEKSSFYGPQKFVALKPKKLVISDEGIAFYTDSMGAYCYKNINRVVTVDLETFAIIDNTATKATFNMDEKLSFVSCSYAGQKDGVYAGYFDTNTNSYQFYAAGNYSAYVGIPLDE